MPNIVLLFAPAGVPVRSVADQIAALLRPPVQIVELSRELFVDGASYLAFVRRTRAEQRADWSRAVDRVASEIAHAEASHVLLIVDGHYFAQRECFSVVDSGRLAALSPGRVITLIDDVYDVVARVRSSDLFAEEDRLSFSLVDALVWRREELLIADHMAQIANAVRVRGESGQPLPLVQHYAAGVKHSVKLLIALVERDVAPAYMSFPISRTRSAPSLYRLIQRHRERVHAALLTFDPITVDERRFLPGSDPHPTALGSRWELTPVLPAARGPEYSAEMYVGSDLAAAKPLIMGDLRSRAFRYVQQANSVIVFRPFLDSTTIHRGVEGEVRLAQSLGKDVIVFEPDKVGAQTLREMGIAGVHENEEQFYEAVFVKAE